MFGRKKRNDAQSLEIGNQEMENLKLLVIEALEKDLEAKDYSLVRTQKQFQISLATLNATVTDSLIRGFLYDFIRQWFAGLAAATSCIGEMEKKENTQKQKKNSIRNKNDSQSNLVCISFFIFLKSLITKSI